MPTNRIVLGNVWARLDGERERAWQVLSYRPKGYFFNPAYKARRWDGWNRPFNTKTGLYPAGLTPYLIGHLTQPFEVVDERPPASERRPWVVLNKDQPFMEHQMAAIRTAVEYERGVLQHVVAAGKQRTGIGLIAAIGRPTLVLVHRKDLFAQFLGGTKANHEGCLDLLKGPRVGRCGAGTWAPGDVTVATFQTIWSKLSDEYIGTKTQDWLKTIEFVLVDECQHTPADTLAAIMKLMPHARWRIGLSATAFRGNPGEEDPETFYKVQSWLGPIIHEVTPNEGVEFKRTVPAQVFLIKPTWPLPIWPTYTDDGGHVKPRLSYQEEYQQGIVENEPRNQGIISLADRFRKTGPVLILCDRIEHGRDLSTRLGCTFIQGETDMNERGAGWAGLRNGTISCIVATKLADEGIDIPGIQFLLLAGGGRAKHLLIQRIGRGQRASEGKEQVYVFDWLDDGHRLAKHSAERIELYSEQPTYTLTETTVEALL
jgi:superfamily II DNA or RNA helicase